MEKGNKIPLLQTHSVLVSDAGMLSFRVGQKFYAVGNSDFFKKYK